MARKTRTAVAHDLQWTLINGSGTYEGLKGQVIIAIAELEGGSVTPDQVARRIEGWKERRAPNDHQHLLRAMVQAGLSRVADR